MVLIELNHNKKYTADEKSPIYGRKMTLKNNFKKFEKRC